MKTIDSIAFASSAACFAIVIQVGPESAFLESHRNAALFLGAGISTGVVSACLRQARLFETPGTVGNRVFCAIGILVSLGGIGAYMHAFRGVVATGFFGGAALLAAIVLQSVVQPKVDALATHTKPPTANEKSEL